MRTSGKYLARIATLFLAGLVTGTASADTAFGCRNLVRSGLLPAVEGTGGHFFRVEPDLISDHRLEPGTIDAIAALSKALQARGTTLIYVPIPTKALVMPDALPPLARQLGYDPDIAATLYDGTVGALRAAGVRTVDARHVLRRTRGGADPVFQADPRLTAAGAETLAAATARAVADLPGYDSLPKTAFTTGREGTEILPSHIRMMLQENCTARLPLVEAERHTTTATATAAMVSANSNATGGDAGIVVVGTRIAGLRPSNFAGFLATYASLDTRQYSAPETDPFAAISSYLTSTAYTAAPPRVLVWTVPVWANLADRGDQPMRELIAAAGATCDRALDIRVDRDGVGHADLSVTGVDPRLTLKLDSDSGSRAASFAFHGPQDRLRLRKVQRTPDQDTGGRFFMPLTALWPEGVREVTITVAGGFGPDPKLTICNGEG